MSVLSVGLLRAQTALCDSNKEVVLIPRGELVKLLGGRRIVLTRAYPDTTNDRDEWVASFKIEGELWPDQNTAGDRP